MIKAIIFDFDGVIVESVDIKTKAFVGLFEHEGGEVVENDSLFQKGIWSTYEEGCDCQVYPQWIYSESARSYLCW